MSKAVLNAVNAITAKVGAVSKTGVNQHHGYAYATIADVMTKLQPLLAEHGLVVLQDQYELQVIADQMLAISYTFRLAHKDGEILDLGLGHTGTAALFVGRNATLDDKAANKCHTAARKYFLLALFQIPSLDADDADAHPGGQAYAPINNVAKQDGNSIGRGQVYDSGRPQLPDVGSPPLAPIGEAKEIRFTGNWTQWGSEFAAILAGVSSPDELWDWVGANDKHLEDVAKRAPKISARLTALIGEARARIGDNKTADKAAPAPLDALFAELDTAMTRPTVDEIWKKHESAISKNDLDVAVAAYEEALARVTTP